MERTQPRRVKDLSRKARNRLHARFPTLSRRRKQHDKVKVAVAPGLAAIIRELGVRMPSAAS